MLPSDVLLLVSRKPAGQIIKWHPQGGERSGLNKLSPLIIETCFLLQYQREIFKRQPKHPFYTPLHGYKSLARKVDRERESYKTVCRKRQKVSGRKRENKKLSCC